MAFFIHRFGNEFYFLKKKIFGNTCIQGGVLVNDILYCLKY